MTWDSQWRGLNLCFDVDRRAPGTFLQCCPEQGVCGASCWSLHGQEPSWTFAQEHVWLSRRWSELGNSQFAMS